MSSRSIRRTAIRSLVASSMICPSDFSIEVSRASPCGVGVEDQDSELMHGIHSRYQMPVPRHQAGPSSLSGVEGRRRDGTMGRAPRCTHHLPRRTRCDRHGRLAGPSSLASPPGRRSAASVAVELPMSF